MSPWNEIKESLDAKIDLILQSQAKQLDAIVSVRDGLQKLHELQEMKLTRLTSLEEKFELLDKAIRKEAS